MKASNAFRALTVLLLLAGSGLHAYQPLSAPTQDSRPTWKKKVPPFNLNPRDINGYEVMAFAEVQQLVPGPGVALRKYDEGILGREYSLSLIVFPKAEGIKLSYVNLLHVGDPDRGRVYLAGGLGGYALIDSRGESSTFYPFINIPLFAGIHVRHFFCDAGIDLLDAHIVEPFARLGWSF